MPRSNLIDIEVIIHCETSPGCADKGAIFVSDDGDEAKAVWLPKSAIEIEYKQNTSIVTLPERLAIDKGLV